MSDDMSQHIRDFMTPEKMDELASAWEEQEAQPEYGTLPEHFPQITTHLIPYTSSASSRADPFMSVTDTGWLFVEVGNVRIAVPDREEWVKLVTMGEALWARYEASQQQNDPPPPPGVPEEGEADDQPDRTD